MMMSSLSLLAMVCRIHNTLGTTYANGCGGIWDVQSSQAVVEFVRRGIAAKQELHKICENMMDNCLSNNTDGAGVGCDNMTMIVVALLRGQTMEEWYEKVAKRVAVGDGPCAPPEAGMYNSPMILTNS
jgi:protein phosphatase 2C family protein 2/3